MFFSCDAAVAVFWTRFGTPTDEYGSGTEEEIEELIKNGKQVFLYFSDCPASLSTIDNDQYQKIKNFREKYKGKGLYWTYSDIEDFKKVFLNHLSLHFLNLFSEGNIGGISLVKSNLCIKGVEDGKTVDMPIIAKTRYLHCKYMNDLKKNILSTFNNITGIKLSTKNIEQKEESNSDLLTPKSELTSHVLLLSKQIKNIKPLFPSSLAKISDNIKDVISTFAEENSIIIEDDFYYLGDLTIKQSPTGGGPYGLGPSRSFSGNDNEEEKYKLIMQLRNIIDEYSQLAVYFSEVDSKRYALLSLCNIGTDYDEDIDVKLYIQKGQLCLDKDLPYPGDDIIDIANQTLKLIYKPKQTVCIDEYYDYPITPYIPRIPNISMLNSSYENKIEDARRNFESNHNEIFCYTYFETAEYDIICYNQKYLKQNTNSFLPSYLVFNSFPDVIKYEITSKRCPDVIEGKLNLRDGD